MCVTPLDRAYLDTKVTKEMLNRNNKCKQRCKYSGEMISLVTDLKRGKNEAVISNKNDYQNYQDVSLIVSLCLDQNREIQVISKKLSEGE